MLTIVRAIEALRLAALVVEAWAGLAAFDAMRVAGFGEMHRRLASCHVARRSTAAAGDVVWAVEEACVWYVERAYCLQRSVVAAWLLRRHGHSASLVIGYRPVPFESHAWVELDGRVVNDHPQYQKYFRVLERT
jgi:transglutaminase superfamily protein